MDSTKILIMVGRNPKNMRGGASTWILNIDPFFKLDFDVEYLILSERWLNIYWIPDRIKASFYALFFLLMKHKKYDIFLSHSPELSYLATLFSKNVIHIAHGNTNPLTNPTFRWGKIFFNLYEYFSRYVEKHAALLYTVGEEKKGYSTINQPINHKVKPLNPEKKRGLIFAGRLEKVKNIDLIIRAYSLLDMKTKQKHSLHIYGQGSQEKIIKELITQLHLGDYIKLKGHIANNNLIEEINKSSLLLMASSFEGFPMVIAESLTVGTPVISTNVGSIGSVIINGENGSLLPIKFAAEEYKQRIIDILDNFDHFHIKSLESSGVFNVIKVYSILKSDIMTLVSYK